MLDWSQRSGWLRLKILLLIVCIGLALTVIYYQTRPPQPARLAPGVAPDLGRSAARTGSPKSARRRTRTTARGRANHE